MELKAAMASSSPAPTHRVADSPGGERDGDQRQKAQKEEEDARRREASKGRGAGWYPVRSSDDDAGSQQVLEKQCK